MKGGHPLRSNVADGYDRSRSKRQLSTWKRELTNTSRELRGIEVVDGTLVVVGEQGTVIVRH